MNQPDDYIQDTLLHLLPAIKQADTPQILWLFKNLCAYLCLIEGRTQFTISKEFLDDQMAEDIEIRWTWDRDREAGTLKLIDHRGRRIYDEVEVEIVKDDDVKPVVEIDQGTLMQSFKRLMSGE